MSFSLTGKKIVLGLTGGIAAYKTAELIRLLVKQGVEVTCVMTEAARHFIGEATLQGLSGRPVFTDQWDTRISNGMAHIQLSRDADAMIIAPCSTDFMAKLAHGHADDLLSTLSIARNCPLYIAPAMNREMWLNPATQRNVELLKHDGIQLLGPAEGEQACGETGTGRMLEPEQLMILIERALTPATLSGQRILITAGPTIEVIDPVRIISNRSSGKMGYELAQQAYLQGALVTLVSGPTALAAPYGVDVIAVETAQQMLTAVESQIAQQDIFISVAAVADWQVANPSSNKIKKDATGQPPTIIFKENPDILAHIAKHYPNVFSVGFAAETDHLIEHAQAKRLRKGVPLLVANVAQETLSKDDVAFSFITHDAVDHLERLSKKEAAKKLLQRIIQMV